MSEIEARLRELLEKATPGPWGYRVREYDDWGMIRGAETEGSIGPVRPIVAVSRDATADTDFDEHRRKGTDPYEPNGRLIVAAVNAIPQLLDLIAAQREALEGMRDGADLLGQLLGADPGWKYAAAAKAARDWWLAYDAAELAAARAHLSEKG